MTKPLRAGRLTATFTAALLATCPPTLAFAQGAPGASPPQAGGGAPASTVVGPGGPGMSSGAGVPAGSPVGAGATGAGPKTALPPAQPRAPQPGQAKATHDPDWPCVQRKVPVLSYGQMWPGDPLDDAIARWRDDEAVEELVPTLVARRTTRDQATREIAKFAEAAGAEKNAKLTLLFAGVFDEVNSLRGRIMTGIERYARKQRALSERIKDESIKLASQRTGMAAQNSPEFQEKEKTLNWDTRIYDERAHSLNYVCESPVILEQHLFDISRIIQAKMS